MKILLIGANGYLGARLFEDLKYSFELIGTYNKSKLQDDSIQLDITNEKQVDSVFSSHKPDLVIHTANYASSRLADNNESGFTKLNLKATKNIIEACQEYHIKLVFISSFAALTPSDIYGKLKLESEELIVKSKINYFIIRPSLILGYSPNTKNDRPFNRLLKCIDNPSQAQFDTSWKFQPTYIGHISNVIEAAIENNINNKTIHVFCPSIQTQYSTAKDILEPFGINVEPIDKNMNITVQEREERELTNLNLPTCSYEEMVKKIHKEIKNYLNKKS